MIDHQRRIADLALELPGAAEVLSAHGLDFCCRGDQPLAEACASRGLDPAAIAAEIERAHARAAERPGASREAPVAHHEYIWARLPFLVPMAAKLTRQCAHGGDGCGELAGLVAELHGLLLDHLEREAGELRAVQGRSAELVRQRLAALQEEHLATGALLRRIRRAAGLDREPGPGACATERALHAELTRLDRHVRSHVLLEARILAPELIAEATP